MASSTVAAETGLEDGKEYTLGIGSSFTPAKGNAFHIIRYDFKPTSVHSSKPAQINVEKGDNVVVDVPNMQDGGNTTYKGSKRPCTKECLLVVDKTTGEITLEKLSSTIQLKKIRGVTQSSATPSSSAGQNTGDPPRKKQHKATADQEVAPAPRNAPAGNRLSSVESGSGSSSSDTDSESDDSDHDIEEQGKLLQSSLNKDFTPGAVDAVSVEPAAGTKPFCQLHEDLQLTESGSDSD